MFEVMFLMINREVCWHLVCTNQLEIGEKARLHPVQETFFQPWVFRMQKMSTTDEKKRKQIKKPWFIAKQRQKKVFFFQLSVFDPHLLEYAKVTSCCIVM